MTTVKTRIKELRAGYTLTQEEMAKKAGVRREPILSIEKGDSYPSVKLAHDIAKVLQTMIDDLFIFEDTPDPCFSCPLSFFHPKKRASA